MSKIQMKISLLSVEEFHIPHALSLYIFNLWQILFRKLNFKTGMR
jgi:hypothetical protein